MATNKMDWTHINVKITDIRKLSKFYVFTIKDAKTEVDLPYVLTVKDSIFEERLKAYFLREANKVSRDDIMNASWNMYICKGKYIKINKNGEIQNFEMDNDKYYVSYLEIAGFLSSFSSLFYDKEAIN